MHKRSVALLAALTALLSACAHSPPDQPRDPLEPVNRAVFQFNLKADKYVMQPVARGYVAAVPTPARRGIHNVLANFFYPKTIVNDFLQAKFKQGFSDLGRLLLNSTAGLGGLLDVATEAGLPAHDEDFGQTLGYWGVGPGWYLMLPFLGPSDNRDLVGFAGDVPTNPLTYFNDTHNNFLHVKVPVVGLNLIDTRAGLLGSERLMESQFDPYIFVRTAFLQHRQSQVYDGNPPNRDLLLPDDGGGDIPASAASAPAAGARSPAPAATPPATGAVAPASSASVPSAAASAPVPATHSSAPPAVPSSTPPPR
ncbi:MAG: VacJ family lipoprotein [Gammaproteobacteria bacterium]|nr:VacJ family lipoprotein [Gammaproteobacteria bacterium]